MNGDAVNEVCCSWNGDSGEDGDEGQGENDVQEGKAKMCGAWRRAALQRLQLRNASASGYRRFWLEAAG